jgi:hypothetical protein
MKIKDLAKGFAWWDKQVGQILVQSVLCAALPARHFLLSLDASEAGPNRPAGLLH